MKFIQIMQLIAIFILFVNIFLCSWSEYFFAKASKKLAENCTDKNQVAKLGMFLAGSNPFTGEELPRKSLIMKKHRKLLRLHFFIALLLIFLMFSLILAFELYKGFFVYLCLGIQAPVTVIQIIIFIKVLKFRKKTKNESRG